MNSQSDPDQRYTELNDRGESAWSDTFRLPLAPGITIEQTRQAEEYVLGYDMHCRRLRADQIREQRAAYESARQRFSTAIGESNATALRLYLRELRDNTRRTLEPPRGLELDYDLVHRHRLEQASGFLRTRGVSDAKFQESLAALRLPVVSGEVDVRSRGTLLLPADMTMDFGGAGAPDSEWSIIGPPYGGWQHGFDGWSPGGFTWITSFDADPITGLVANQIFLFDVDASDIDLGQYVSDSQVAFWYTPRSTGLVEVFIEAQCGLGLHELLLTDEWGWSDSDTTQVNYVMMHVLHPNVKGPSVAEMSRFVWSSGSTEYVRREFLVAGNVYWVHLFSDGPVRANEPVVIRVGTRSQDGSRTNDVSVRSTSTFRWFIRSVSLRTTG